MASSMINLVLKKAKESVFSSSSFSKWWLNLRQSQPQPSGSRSFSSFLGNGGGAAAAAADQPRLSSPRLMLPPEEEDDDVAAGAGEVQTKVLNLRFWTPAEHHHHLKMKLPQPLLDATCVGSSHGWLAYMNRRDCGFYLANFFRGNKHGGRGGDSSSPAVAEAEIIPLPSIRTLPGVLRVVNNTRPDDPSHVDYLVFHDTWMRIASWQCPEPEHLPEFLVRRMALSSAPNNNNDCVVVIIHHFNSKELAFCRLSSSSSSSWAPLDSPQHRRKHYGGFCDVMYSSKDQLFYALSNSGVIEAWDLSDPASSPKRRDIHIDYRDPPLTTKEGMKCRYRGYLVELPPSSSSGGVDILLVYRRRASVVRDGRALLLVGYKDHLPYKTVEFDIWKLDLERRTGEYVDNLGDTALFLGFNHSFALSTIAASELKPNSIYFAFDTAPHIYNNEPCGGNDMGIYNLEDRSITPLLPTSSFKLEEILLRPIWVAPPTPIHD